MPDVVKCMFPEEITLTNLKNWKLCAMLFLVENVDMPLPLQVNLFPQKVVSVLIPVSSSTHFALLSLSSLLYPYISHYLAYAYSKDASTPLIE